MEGSGGLPGRRGVVGIEGLDAGDDQVGRDVQRPGGGDHGEQGGAHHLRQKGSVAFQESVNVPLVIADPRHPGAIRSDAEIIIPMPTQESRIRMEYSNFCMRSTER